jgi:lysozyme
LRRDVERFVRNALALSPGLIQFPSALGAIGDFCFNLGSGAYRASTLRKRVNAEDWEGARQELAKWVRGGGKVLKGLVIRRAAEAALLPS